MQLRASLMCLQHIADIKYTMNVPELRLPSSSSSVDSVSILEEEADEDKDGNEEGRNTGNISKSKTSSSSKNNKKSRPRNKKN